MKIHKAMVIPAMGGYYNDDLAAISAGVPKDGFLYEGQPRSAGFTSIRQPNDVAEFILMLEDGRCVVGDAMSVCYSAAGGRHGLFRSSEQLPHMEAICAHLEGQRVGAFLEMCEDLESQDYDDALHRPAAMYGISQALLQARAIDQKITPAEVLARELNVEVSPKPISIYVQSEQRRMAVDKAILKRPDVMPHGVVHDIEEGFGPDGHLLREFLIWLVGRLRKYGNDYQPQIHLDIYGLPGVVFDHNPERIADYLSELAEILSPQTLCIETPVLMASRQAQIEMFGQIRTALARRGAAVKLVVDEWANELLDIRAFIEADVTDMVNVKSPDLGSIVNSARAVLECRASGVEPILGGSCAETDIAARVVANVALSVRPAWVMARPGLAIDEGLQIVHNEMARTLAIIDARTTVLE